MNKAVKVFKFGGASVKDAGAIKNVKSILSTYKNDPLVIVISALGKTTNALEGVVDAYFEDRQKAFQLLEGIKAAHYSIMEDLFNKDSEAYPLINDVFVEVEWVLEDEPHDAYDYVYDQIVSIGELVSTKIVAYYLKENGFNLEWEDARGLIKTDTTWREAQIDWEKTQEQVKQVIRPNLDKGVITLTQGFIGSTKDNDTTTLGREGSDYTGAILSYCLDAESMSIWKDVPGVLTADPRLFDNVIKLDRLSYKEAIEMTYYGATVIHPKTIKPLQNKNIPLYVKSFLEPTKEGTVIEAEVDDFNYPPIVMLEKDQVLMQITTKDFSFLVEHHIKDLFTIFDRYRVFVNLMQNTAISFYACVTLIPGRLDDMIKDLKENFNVLTDFGLELITIRHSLPHVYESVTYGKRVMLEERHGKTIQMVVRDVPVIKRKSTI